MEIKTTDEIQDLILKDNYDNVVNDEDKKWVAVDDIIDLVNSGFGLNANALRKHITKSLSTSQSEGTELSLKVPSPNIPCHILVSLCSGFLQSILISQ